jgi:hypothetical protein
MGGKESHALRSSMTKMFDANHQISVRTRSWMIEDVQTGSARPLAAQWPGVTKLDQGVERFYLTAASMAGQTLGLSIAFQ